jgi:hypothetical protein
LRGRVYSAAQVSQHTQLILDLQKTNARASHLVLRLGRMCSQPHRFTALVDELNSLVRWMTPQIFLCEQVMGSGVHKRYDVINVILGNTCDHCLESGTTRQRQTNEPHLEELSSSQAWRIQVEELSGLTILVAHSVAQISFSPRRTVDQSLRSLAALSKILSRQRRHMEQISVRQPTAIRVIDDRSAACPDCQRPYRAPGTD